MLKYFWFIHFFPLKIEICVFSSTTNKLSVLLPDSRNFLKNCSVFIFMKSSQAANAEPIFVELISHPITTSSFYLSKEKYLPFAIFLDQKPYSYHELAKILFKKLEKLLNRLEIFLPLKITKIRHSIIKLTFNNIVI